MMFIGFIPFVAIVLSTWLSFDRQRPQAASALWLLSIVLIASWAVFHGSHHLPMLRTLSAW